MPGFNQIYLQKTFPENCHTKEFKNSFSTHSFCCPDGTTRIITLKNWFWMTLFWLCTDKGKKLDDIISYCWELVQEEVDVEYQFRAIFEYYIHRAVMHYVSEEDNIANDDWYNPDWLDENH